MPSSPAFSASSHSLIKGTCYKAGNFSRDYRQRAWVAAQPTPQGHPKAAIRRPDFRAAYRFNRDHLGQIVRGTVEETLNGPLEAEAERLCDATSCERTTAAAQSRRAALAQGALSCGIHQKTDADLAPLALADP